MEKGATAIKDLGQTTGDKRVLISILRDRAATASVISTIGDLQSSTLVPMGTMGMEESRKLATQVADQGGHLGAPVLGSKPQAFNGTLLVMAGGEVQVFEEQRPLLSHLCQEPLLVGPVDSGADTKLALNRQEAATDAGHTYADPNFSTALLRKDLRLFLEEATTAGLQDQGLRGLLTLLEQAKGTDLDKQDYCALHELTVLI